MSLADHDDPAPPAASDSRADSRAGGRQGGRRGRRTSRGAGRHRVGNQTWHNWENPYRPIDVLSDDQVEAIHLASLDVLARTGIRVLNDEALALYRRAGARVQADGIVRFDPALVMDLVGQAPATVTLHARRPARSVDVGGRKVAVATVGGAPFFSDLDGGRRAGTLADFENLCRLAASFDVIHVLGPNVEPQDIDPRVRHLPVTRAMVTLTDKVPFVFFRGTQAVADCFEILRIAHGLSPAALRETPLCYSVANSNSPLQLDRLMCRGIIDAARAGQLMVLTPFTLAGAMAPVTIVGALTQQNAEALAGLSLAQIVRPGAPVCYGSFTSNVDMRSGSPAFGTPEYTKAAFASGQLARRYGLPLRSSSTTASNAPDAQAAYEAQMSLWGALMGGCNLLLHGAGWLESGLTASAEKFIIDVEMLQMFAELMQPLPFDRAALGVEAIREVGHGGHFFGAAHTIERFETAFYTPMLSDWRPFEAWRDAGAIDATRRANAIYHQTLREFEPPSIDPGRLEEIDAFIARRMEEGGADIEQ